jgi:hypothetical protein
VAIDARDSTKMDYYNRLATPELRRFTIRISCIEIELRTRPQPGNERVSPAERAFRRARAEEMMSRERSLSAIRMMLMI